MVISNIRELGIVFFALYALVILLGALLSFLKANKTSKEMNYRDVYSYSMALFFLLIAIGLLVRIYFTFFLAATEEEFLLQMTATERTGDLLPSYVVDGRLQLLQLLWQIQLAFTTAGTACLLYGTEYQIIKKTKYGLTIFELILVPFVLFTPYNLSHIIFYLTFIPPFVWIILYFLMAKMTTGEIRKNAMIFLIGFIIFFAGAALNSGTGQSILFGSENGYIGDFALIFSCIISPWAMIIGFGMMLRGILKKI